MSTDDDAALPTDDEPVDPEPDRPHPSVDPEAPEPDALDQAREVNPGWRVGRVSRGIEVPEADAIDQATEIPDEPEP
jgi:hypothetical protein